MCHFEVREEIKDEMCEILLREQLKKLKKVKKKV